MSALHPEADIAHARGHVSFVPILLQKSKIERRRKSRQGGFLDAPAAARLSGTNTKVGGCFGMKRCGPSRLSARSASAVFKIFALHPKNTFATISATSRPMHCNKKHRYSINQIWSGMLYGSKRADEFVSLHSITIAYEHVWLTCTKRIRMPQGSLHF
ncbi:hypothetical protein [Bradyrhizobium erythrophlei]|uniref:hypothetical protein n=1 Tax=Bradyrhizobium erythrophlei TaxID=1437360 RepID=UPI0012ABEF6F|nr:hypothetical protein [Bradyrhizobium erythrophlei]